MIHPTEPAVRRPVVRRILRCLLRLTVQTVPTAASTPVIILVIQTVRLVLRLPTPEVAAAQPVTDVTPKPVIILIKPAAHRAVPVIPDVLAALIPFLTDAAVPAQNVLPAVTHLLLTGVLITEHVMVTVAKTVLGIHVMNVAASQVAAEEAPAGAVAQITVMKFGTIAIMENKCMIILLPTHHQLVFHLYTITNTIQLAEDTDIKKTSVAKIAKTSNYAGIYSGIIFNPTFRD